MRRLEFSAPRPFHPIRFLNAIVERLPQEDGQSAYSDLLDDAFPPPPPVAAAAAAAPVAAPADPDPSAALAEMMADHGASKAASSSGRGGGPWAHVVRATSGDLWMASQPALNFDLHYVSCATKLTEARPCQHGGGGGGRSVTPRTQHVAIVHCGADEAALRADLEACLLTDGEMPAYEARCAQMAAAQVEGP